MAETSRERQRKIARHLRRVKMQMLKNLVKSYLGWWTWHKVTRLKGFSDNTAVILLPDCDRETSKIALLYLDQFLEKNRRANAVILTHDTVVLNSAHLFSQKILKTVYLSRKKAEWLMQYYCLYEFDRRFVIASITEPYGRNGDRLIGKRNTTKEDVFVIGIYRLYPFTRPQVPAYDGCDNDIKAFLKVAI